MKLLKSAALLSVAAASLWAIPAPTEYELANFKQAVRNADLIIEGTVTLVDTISTATIRTITKEITIDSLHKGYTGKRSITVTENEEIGAVGEYDHKFNVGMETIICLNDDGKRGVVSDPLDQFNIESDTIAAPRSGLGFADDMKMYKNPVYFRELIKHTMEHEELMWINPFQPSLSDEISVDMKINLSGGAVLDSIVAKQTSSTIVEVNVYKTPCEGMCIDLYYILDTTIALPSIERSGRYRVITNSIRTGSGDISKTLVDSLRFELYPSSGSTSIDNGSLVGGTSGYNGGIRSFTQGSTVQFDLSNIKDIGTTAMDLSIVDMKGRTLWSGDESEIINNSFIWNGHAISKGIYLFQIKSGNSLNVQRFSVQ